VSDVATFLEHWARVGAGVGAGVGASGGAWTALGASLGDRHAEPQRAYHGLRHVLAVLDTTALLDPARSAEPALQLAAFFHDAVYDPTSPSNEEDSAVMAEAELGRLDVTREVIAETARLIRATNGHQTDGTPATELFLDADLAILGTPPQLYDRYATAIRLEYGHLADDAYRSGRAEVLQHFLDRPRLFFTKAGRERFEKQARLNLTREIEDLVGS